MIKCNVRNLKVGQKVWCSNVRSGFLPGKIEHINPDFVRVAVQKTMFKKGTVTEKVQIINNSVYDVFPIDENDIHVFFHTGKHNPVKDYEEIRYGKSL